MIRPSISVVVPVYNSEKTIGELVRQMTEELQDYSSDFVLVNDGSSDQSYYICRRLAEEDCRVKFISFFRNFGQLSAILAGLREADGDIIIVMDDDLQNPPTEVHKLLAAMQQGYDFVFGVPSGQMQQSLSRRLGSYINRRMAEIVFNKPRSIYASSYYALSRRLAQEIVKYDGPYPYIAGFIFRTTSNGCQVPVEHHQREYGKSRYTFKKLLRLWMIGFTNFSILPLRISSIVGVMAAIVGFIFLAFLVANKLLRPNVIYPGWTSVIGAVILAAGVQLLALGMLGEYIGRIFLLLNKSPQYSVKEKYNCGPIE